MEKRDWINAWVENSLGDRVSADYTIKVTDPGNPLVSIQLKKELSEAADGDYVFVFKCEKLSDDESTVISTFYQTIKISQGDQESSITIINLETGTYRFTEIESNWRYEAVGDVTKSVTATDPEVTKEVTFQNARTNNKWSSGNADITNKMKDIN